MQAARRLGSVHVQVPKITSSTELTFVYNSQGIVHIWQFRSLHLKIRRAREGSEKCNGRIQGKERGYGGEEGFQV